MDSFATGRGIRAADLNRLASDAARRGLAGSAYLAHSNGFELVQRNPRRGHTTPRGRSTVAAPCPQWRVTAEPPESEGGDWTLHCAGGTVLIFESALEAEESGSPEDRNTTYELANTARSVTLPPANLGAARAGRVVWRWADGSKSGKILLVDGATPDGSCDVVLATVGIQESGAPLILQRHIDTVFFTVPTHADGDDGGGGGGEEEGPPPCGHPGNGPGGPTDPDHDGNEDDHPGDGPGEDGTDHPGDFEGENGVTPESGGDDCP